jgi:hypothetical protein
MDVFSNFFFHFVIKAKKYMLHFTALLKFRAVSGAVFSSQTTLSGPTQEVRTINKKR